jgi:hypothetical protein
MRAPLLFFSREFASLDVVAISESARVGDGRRISDEDPKQKTLTNHPR